jgi:hypothetical protein
MPKAFMVGIEGQTLASGEEGTFFGSIQTTVEAQNQVRATEAMTMSQLKARIASGNSGTATFRFRKNTANGNQTFQITGVGENVDAVNTDALVADDLFNWAYTDTGTDAVSDYISCVMELAIGHGCMHGCANVAQINMDLAGTRYINISGFLEGDGNTVPAIVQYRNRAYTDIDMLQVRVNNNARANDSVFRYNVNGVAVGNGVTFAAAETGTKVVSGLGIKIKRGDLVCVQIEQGAGSEDMDVAFLLGLFRSSSNESEIFSGRTAGAVNLRTASATPNFYLPSGTNGLETTESAEQVALGFPATIYSPQIYVESNTYTSDCTFSLRVDGADRISVTIPAGAIGWFGNDGPVVSLPLGTELISEQLVGGGSGSLGWVQHGFIVGPALGSGAGISDGLGGITSQSVSGIGGVQANQYLNITQVQ